MDQLVAIALFGGEVSPRFCQARGVDIYRWDGERAQLEGHVLLGETCYPDRLEMLASRKVDILLCGAFPCEKAPLAISLGITVVSGLFGPESEIVRCLGTILDNAPPLRG